MLDYCYQPQLVQARFIRRVNRFVAEVLVDGQGDLAHLPTSGRLRELLVAGAEVWLRPTTGGGRQTHWCLELVRCSEGGLVSVNSQLPNRLMEIWLRQRRFEGFTGYREIKREPQLGEGRSDLRLSGNGECLIEVKSVTLVIDGQARFPDAPTMRGARHLRDLAMARGKGVRAAVFFVIQRRDAQSFAPNVASDPEFARALRDAHNCGVEVYAVNCVVTSEGMSLGEHVPIVLY